MTTKILDLSNVISVSILSTPTVLGVLNINTVALFSRETPSWGDSYKVYTNATDVGTDFGTGSNAYAIATAFFAQQPNPLATQGYLVIVPRQSGGTETVRTAIARILSQVYFFGIIIDEEMYSQAAEFAALAVYVQTLDKLFFYASSQQADYATNGLLDLIRQASETHTRCLFYSDGTASHTQLMAAAYAARLLSTDFSGSNTAQTIHLKSLAGIVADTVIDQTELVKVQAAGVDVNVSIAGIVSIYSSGLNAWSDEVYNELWLKFALETAGYNFLRTASSKIPQTETGLEGLKNAYRGVLDQAVANGFLAPGTWTASTPFGDPQALIRCVKDIGYYVYSSPISKQSIADRVARKAPLIQIAAKTAGAIHSSNIQVNVNI